MSIAIYATGHREPDVHARNYVPVFPNVNEAHDWFVKFISGREHKFQDDGRILLDHEFPISLHISGCDWDKLMRAEPTGRELRSDVARLILRFKYGSWDEDHRKPIEQTTTEIVENDDGTIELADLTPTMKLAKQKATKPERASKASLPDGYTTISALCATLGVQPTHARAALRASKRTKPEYGWAFSKEELPEIKKLLATVKK